MPSFDTILEANLVEVKNAVDQAAKEVGTRFDFKGTSANLELKDKTVTLFGDSDFQITQVDDILRNKLARNSAMAALYAKPEAPPPSVPQEWTDIESALRSALGNLTLDGEVAQEAVLLSLIHI